MQCISRRNEFFHDRERNSLSVVASAAMKASLNVCMYYTDCIMSICNKTNTNSLHSILRKIGHVIQIVVHQFVHKAGAKKKLKKIGPH